MAAAAAGGAESAAGGLTSPRGASAPCRCSWVNLKNPDYIRYHDEEWGIPSRDDQHLFEMLVLETFQAGLSWECVLRKRDGFRVAFDNFDPAIVAAYDDAKLTELAEDPGIVRNKQKIAATVVNAQAFCKIQDEYGSFADYLWGFTNDEVVEGDGAQHTTSPLSDLISVDLRQKGMKFVGSTIVYSFLQAVGVISDHESSCDFATPAQKAAKPVTAVTQTQEAVNSAPHITPTAVPAQPASAVSLRSTAPAAAPAASRSGTPVSPAPVVSSPADAPAGAAGPRHPRPLPYSIPFDDVATPSTDPPRPLVNRVYRHYKGDYYLVLGFARHSETGEELVIYRELYGGGALWARPLSMFCEQIYPPQGQIHRFELQEIKSRH